MECAVHAHRSTITRSPFQPPPFPSPLPRGGCRHRGPEKRLQLSSFSIRSKEVRLSVPPPSFPSISAPRPHSPSTQPLCLPLQMASFLKCPVCREVYDSDRLTPRLLTCGHSVCTSCLSRMLDAGAIVCPIDQTRTQTPAATELPKNLALLDLIPAQEAPRDGPASAQEPSPAGDAPPETTATATATTATPPASSGVVCAVHNEPTKVFDTLCGRPVCLMCVALEHSGHTFIPLEDAGEFLQGQTRTSVTSLHERAARVGEASRRVRDHLANLQQKTDACAQNIKGYFAKVRTEERNRAWR